MSANDNTPPRPTSAVRMIPLIGAIHDDGRFERYDVVELLRVPEEELRRPLPPELLR